MMKAGYTLNIAAVDNGYIVTAGCVTLIFTKEALLTEFGRWIENPRRVEAEYGKRFRDIEAPGGFAEGIRAYGGPEVATQGNMMDLTMAMPDEAPRR